MAQPDNRKLALIRELQEARESLQSDGRAVRRAIDLPSRIQSNFRSHRWVWIGATSTLCLIAARLILRRRAPCPASDRQDSSHKTSTGITLIALKLAFTAAKPLLMSWAGHKLQEWMEIRLTQFQEHAAQSDSADTR